MAFRTAHRGPATTAAAFAALVLFSSLLAPSLALAQDAQDPTRAPWPTPQPDSVPALADPARPVTRIGRDSVTFQWFTATPSETRLQIRTGDLPMTAWRPERKKTDPWAAGTGVRVARGPAGTRTFHTLTVTGLAPGRRHYYRLYDPGAKPTARERQWGAQAPWRREYAVSTLAPAGRRTVVRIPVKVLLMPNVVNVRSARAEDGTYAPPPPRRTEAELARLREEYAIASRFFFVNSGFRYWVDFDIFVDDRWQRWGDEPQDAPAAFYRGLPVSRSYSGKDFDPPGGGAFTIVDTAAPQRSNSAPVFEERPYAGQVEQSFPRRWNAKTKAWEYYSSGGGTFGVDGFPRGVPGRSQFLGGPDTAWLAAHEFHHQMESQGAFSLADREDERITFDHPSPRGKDNPWNTAGRHGQHWDVLAFWDRTLTDAQWLRVYFGETVTVADADQDGVPDDDPRLPFDEKRFGSDPRRARTDGRLTDLAKAQLSTWAPAALQQTFTKPPFQAYSPSPRDADSDRDGTPDGEDAWPLYPWPPFVWPRTAAVDGDPGEWRDLPLAGERQIKGGGRDGRVAYRHSYDAAAYYGCLSLAGPWERVEVTLDGEGRGVFSGAGVQNLVVTRDGDAVAVKPQGAGAPGLVWKAATQPDGTTTVEFSLPNGGSAAGVWNWRGAGREVGVAIEAAATGGAIYSLHEPYRLFYCRMLEGHGQPPPPPVRAPAELTAEAATKVLRPGDPAIKTAGQGWRLEGGRYAHRGNDESALYVEVPAEVGEFDLWMRFEAKQDAILGGFAKGTKQMGAGEDYIAFVGGYANTVTRFRLFGREAGDDDTAISPGVHMMQLSRRGGYVWCLFDGKVVLAVPDPDPAKRLDRLAVIGGYNGDQVVHEIRARY